MENQDAAQTFFCSDSNGGMLCLALLSDGMGGLANGKEAAWAALGATSSEFFRGFPYVQNLDSMHSTLESAVMAANEALLSLGESAEGPMGATLVLAACFKTGDCFYANAGDSKLILFSGRKARLLSHSHSWVQSQVDEGLLTDEEACHSDRRNALIEYIGKPDLKFHMGFTQLEPGDCLALMTDGVSSLFTDAELFKMVEREIPESWADIWFDAAKNAGETDNQTIIIVRCLPEESKAKKKSLMEFLLNLDRRSR
jgi:serine/threonine protein phosphatase PrpC